MRILYVYQYYNTPDCPTTARHFTFIKHLAEMHEVTLLTSTANQRTRITERFPWLPENVRAEHFDVKYQMPAVPRFRAFASFALRAIARGVISTKPDIVVGISTPLSAAWAASVVARQKHVPWVFEVKDLWPDFPVQMGGVRSRRMQRRLYKLENQLYNSAQHVVTLSQDMTDHVETFVDPAKVSTIVNGTDFYMVDADFDETALRKAHALEGKKIVFYGGTLGRANDIPLLIDTARQMQNRSDIAFVLAGHGYHSGRTNEAASLLPNLIALPPLPKHEVLHWFRMAHLTVVPFLGLPVLAAISPAKFFDSLAAGTPVIVTNPGWTRRFVEEHGVGRYVPPSDPDALCDAITELFSSEDVLSQMSRRSRAIAEVEFDRQHLAGRFEEVLLRAADCSPEISSTRLELALAEG